MYVNMMGYLYRLTKVKYKKYLQARIVEDYDTCAKLLGNSLGYIKNITDLGKEEARDLLKEIK